MYTHKNINNQRFTVRLCTVAKVYNFKKVGSLEKFLKQKLNDNPSIKVNGGTVSIKKLLEEIEKFKIEE